MRLFFFYVLGLLFILSTVIWPLLPVLVPAHISGALTIVITLRYVLQAIHAWCSVQFGRGDCVSKKNTVIGQYII